MVLIGWQWWFHFVISSHVYTINVLSRKHETKKKSCKIKLQTLKTYKSYMLGVNSNNHYNKKQLTPIVSIIFLTFYIWLYLNMSIKSVVDHLCHIAWEVVKEKKIMQKEREITKYKELQFVFACSSMTFTTNASKSQHAKTKWGYQ